MYIPHSWKSPAVAQLYSCLFRFIKHYEGRRAPFVIIVNPVLVQKPDLLDGIIEFVEYAIGAFPVSSFIVVQISPSLSLLIS